ncbi:Membrane proteins related to metalloendopeptidases [Tessaracoccus bendigoensis DSM 12906]|uniref:Membrane proteins related to metalloendopeptidases n=1 Tax=Tessaracoccus bendigoensis DSM 12906 TaxID=1123357 RepID=A0A1M6FY78_9ACTN|nr:M23 family metallopeptidase [Tessaracoccus bendigoensis]SHJ02661.1 Membrane proteins related to metalloendopeptidases [Tessaracoccus bendigoensis DSM 12906]
MWKALVVIGAALTVPLAPILVFAGALAGPQTATQTVSAMCAGWAGDTPASIELDAGQMNRAALIYATALDTGAGPAGAVVGIATAMQESVLGAHPASHNPNSDGDVGLFQQRSLVGWYADGTTQAENLRILADDAYQARTFYSGHTTTAGWHIPGLTDIDGWQRMSVAEAAQAVQVSAYPDAYAKHEGLARTLVALFAGQPAGLANCGPMGPSLDCAPTGMPSERGQTPDALRVMRCIHSRWPQIRSLLGVRPGDPKDHGSGRAVDVMIPNYFSPAGIALGTEIAEWARTNDTALGVTYVIWREHLWSVARADEGWRRCGQAASCYTGPDPSAAHLDHVHISVHGTQGTGTSAVGSGSVVLPVDRYRLTSRFGDTGPRWKKAHTGLDFAAPTGTPIQAITAGTITRTGPAGAYGNLTTLTTSDGTVIYYAHQSAIHVTVDQRVTAGTVIGKVGATGNVTGPHLHLEVRIAGIPTDPDRWLRTRGLTP